MANDNYILKYIDSGPDKSAYSKVTSQSHFNLYL